MAVLGGDPGAGIRGPLAGHLPGAARPPAGPGWLPRSLAPSLTAGADLRGLGPPFYIASHAILVPEGVRYSSYLNAFWPCFTLEVMDNCVDHTRRASREKMGSRDADCKQQLPDDEEFLGLAGELGAGHPDPAAVGLRLNHRREVS